MPDHLGDDMRKIKSEEKEEEKEIKGKISKQIFQTNFYIVLWLQPSMKGI